MKAMRGVPAKNSGFTLIEIAIVLVIIGLILGGVLKGQEMITNAKIKRVINDFDGVATAVFSYQDRYSALPGDDNRANSRWGATNGSGNGVLGGGWYCTNGTDETCLFWQHVRNSGLIPGETTGAGSTALPFNSFGGVIGIEDNNYGINGVVVCMSEINGANAEIIDLKIDDGLPGSGNLRAHTNNNANSGLGASYNPDTTYNMCRRL